MISKEFPMFGNFSSKPWKNESRFFQCLELSVCSVYSVVKYIPMFGKLSVTPHRIYAIFRAVKKKSYMAVKKVREFIEKQPDEVQSEYLKIVEQLEKDGRLIEPFGKKLDKEFFEIRVRRGR